MSSKSRNAKPKARQKAVRPRGSVIDLFCGVGGLSHGFSQEGYKIVAGVDVDEACRYPYEINNRAPFIAKDVGRLSAEYVASLFVPREPKILVGCAPCQPFSKYNQKNDDPKWRLVNRFSALIRKVRPDIISMENVPRLLEFRSGKVFSEFKTELEDAGYKVWHKVVFAPDYGIPQSRHRLVLLASKHGNIELLPGRLNEKNYITVRKAIGHLPRLAAGGFNRRDPLHRASALSDRNLKRIQASSPGGSWQDWDDDLVATCHQEHSGQGYRSVYGRMRYDEPAPTITTQFFGFGNGRFGHPTQDRAISLREGAILQSFPPNYVFQEPNTPIHMKTLGRLIGNAVPVLLGKAIAKSIRRHIDEQKL